MLYKSIEEAIEELKTNVYIAPYFIKFLSHEIANLWTEDIELLPTDLAEIQTRSFIASKKLMDQLQKVLPEKMIRPVFQKVCEYYLSKAQFVQVSDQ